MFAKIFGQIFDSSISADYLVRHIFMDLLVLADRDGVVDMTVDAIARRTNVPEDIVAHAIQKLMEPDRQSRSGEEDGRRMILLDSHRDWGWQIVNYDHYRQLHDDDARRTYFRDKKREYRAAQRGEKLSNLSNHVNTRPNMSNGVQDSPTKSTQAEAEAEAEVSDAIASSSPIPRKRVSEGQKKRDKKKRNSPPTKTDTAKERHALFKAAIFNYWKSKNPDIDCPWQEAEGSQLEMWLRSSPNTSLTSFVKMLRNRYRSEVVHSDRPSLWIKNITSFANGPLDRFGKPLGGVKANGRSTTQSKQNATVAAVKEVVAGIRAMDSRGTGQDRGPDGGGNQQGEALFDDRGTT